MARAGGGAGGGRGGAAGARHRAGGRTQRCAAAAGRPAAVRLVFKIGVSQNTSVAHWTAFRSSRWYLNMWFARLLLK